MEKNIVILLLIAQCMISVVNCGHHSDDIIIFGGKNPSIIKGGKHGSTIILGGGHKHETHDDHNDQNEDYNDYDFGHLLSYDFGHNYDFGDNWWRR